MITSLINPNSFSSFQYLGKVSSFIYFFNFYIRVPPEEVRVAGAIPPSK